MNKNDSFSVRMGFEPKQEMQINGLNRAARIAFYELTNDLVNDYLYDEEGHIENNMKKFLVKFSRKFFLFSYDDTISTTHAVTGDVIGEAVSEKFDNKFESLFMRKKHYRVYDAIEYFFSHLTDMVPPRRFLYRLTISKIYHDKINEVVSEENVGFKFFEGKFVPITNDEQLDEIARATRTPYQNANNHIRKATNFLSNRENPDYANSIKESIIAVEAAVKELAGNNKATLGAALDQLEKCGVAIHPAFKLALSQLFGFTSDAAGIRHGGKGEPIQQDQATARFMLITCSAFVNYLIANSPTGDK